MQKFDTLTGVAAPLPMINVDTDMIIGSGAATPVRVSNFCISSIS